MIRHTQHEWELVNAVENLLDIGNYSVDELEFVIQELETVDLDWIECDEINVKAMTRAYKAVLKYFKTTLKNSNSEN